MIGWLCLMGGLGAAVWTLSAVEPPLHWLVRGFGFAAALLLSELGVLQLVACLGFAALFYQAGASATLPGQLGLVFYAVASLAAVVLEVRALSAARITATAVDQLGAISVPSRLQWRTRPVALSHRRVQRVADLPYGPARRNRLDVYTPREAAGAPRPVLLQIHGGAWVTGSKEAQARPLLFHLAAAGWVCVSINYRLGPRHHWPAQLDDCKAALAWALANVASHGGDPSRIVVTGGSAGGHLAAHLALTSETKLAGCAPIYAPFDLPNLFAPYVNKGVTEWVCRAAFGCASTDREALARASPLSYVHAEAPPFLVIQGTADNIVPVGQARAFVQALRGVSREPVMYVELPGAVHAFDLFRGSRSAATVAAVHRFAEWAVAPRGALAAAPHQ